MFGFSIGLTIAGIFILPALLFEYLIKKGYI